MAANGKFAAAILAFVSPSALWAGSDPTLPVIVRGGANAISLGVGDVEPLTPDALGSVAQFKLVEKPGYRTPLHVHDKTDETFYVLEGRLTLQIDGERHELAPGDYVFLPRGTAHAQGNLSSSRVVLLTTLVPGDFAAFFRARAELVKTIPPEHADYGAAMRELGKKHDIRIVGSSPF